MKLTIEKISSLLGVDAESVEKVHLSGKQIQELGNLSQCKNLTELHLTGNRFQFKRHIDGVFFIPNLKSLDLSGSPLCKTPNYREYIISHAPQTLTHLDGKEISEQERQRAEQQFPNAREGLRGDESKQSTKSSEPDDIFNIIPKKRGDSKAIDDIFGGDYFSQPSAAVASKNIGKPKPNVSNLTFPGEDLFSTPTSTPAAQKPNPTTNSNKIFTPPKAPEPVEKKKDFSTDLFELESGKRATTAKKEKDSIDDFFGSNTKSEKTTEKHSISLSDDLFSLPTKSEKPKTSSAQTDSGMFDITTTTSSSPKPKIDSMFDIPSSGSSKDRKKNEDINDLFSDSKPKSTPKESPASTLSDDLFSSPKPVEKKLDNKSFEISNDLFAEPSKNYFETASDDDDDDEEEEEDGGAISKGITLSDSLFDEPTSTPTSTPTPKPEAAVEVKTNDFPQSDLFAPISSSPKNNEKPKEIAILESSSQKPKPSGGLFDDDEDLFAAPKKTPAVNLFNVEENSKPIEKNEAEFVGTKMNTNIVLFDEYTGDQSDDIHSQPQEVDIKQTTEVEEEQTESLFDEINEEEQKPLEILSEQPNLDTQPQHNDELSPINDHFVDDSNNNDETQTEEVRDEDIHVSISDTPTSEEKTLESDDHIKVEETEKEVEEEEEEEEEEEDLGGDVDVDIQEFFYPLLFLKERKVSATLSQPLLIAFSIENEEWNLVIKVEASSESERVVCQVAVIEKVPKSFCNVFSLSRSSLLSLLTGEISLHQLSESERIEGREGSSFNSVTTFSEIFLSKEEYSAFYQAHQTELINQQRVDDLKISMLYLAKFAFIGNGLNTSVSVLFRDAESINLSIFVTPHTVEYKFERLQTAFAITTSIADFMLILRGEVQLPIAYRDGVLTVDNVIEFMIFMTAFHFDRAEYDVYDSKWRSFHAALHPQNNNNHHSSHINNNVQKFDHHKVDVEKKNNDNNNIDIDDSDNDPELLRIRSKCNSAFIKGDSFGQFFFTITKGDSIKHYLFLINQDKLDILSVRPNDSSRYFNDEHYCRLTCSEATFDSIIFGENNFNIQVMLGNLKLQSRREDLPILHASFNFSNYQA